VVADYLKRRGVAGAKVVVLDANPGIQAEPETFAYAFNVLHKDVIEYVPNAVVQEVDRRRTAHDQRADGSRRQGAELYPGAAGATHRGAVGVNTTGFVPVNPLTTASLSIERARIGDAGAVPGDLAVPKSGHGQLGSQGVRGCIIRRWRGTARHERRDKLGVLQPHPPDGHRGCRQFRVR
jgi:hypothetical protein